ncbi:hypothetical protein NDU88_000355 [Pleurodeles waltl]|uniref:Uncharacterized protein n=1 Tax=Pleurodeles waltl TaxID=8319 RepID=A0AAV7S7H1_PLEWA|nr:hypothetical protein NDU88_000355 [Pleurodeles waltl]
MNLRFQRKNAEVETGTRADTWAVPRRTEEPVTPPVLPDEKEEKESSAVDWRNCRQDASTLVAKTGA